MAKQTKAKADELSVFDHFVGLTLKGSRNSLLEAELRKSRSDLSHPLLTQGIKEFSKYSDLEETILTKSVWL